jgi:phosphocarrier protein HPr
LLQSKTKLKGASSLLVTRKLKVKNPMGLHTRPATVIVKLLQNSKSEINFTHKRLKINAKSILSLLMLAAKKNAVITVTVIGKDAEETMNKLAEAFELQFGE